MNRSKQKGTRGETQVVKYLTACGLSAERRALSGAADQGDIKFTVGDYEMTLEVKAGKQTENPSRAQLTEWLRQTVVEGENAGCDAALVVVRHRRSMKDAEVYVPMGDLIAFMHLDEFANQYK